MMTNEYNETVNAIVNFLGKFNSPVQLNVIAENVDETMARTEIYLSRLEEQGIVEYVGASAWRYVEQAVEENDNALEMGCTDKARLQRTQDIITRNENLANNSDDWQEACSYDDTIIKYRKEQIAILDKYDVEIVEGRSGHIVVRPDGELSLHKNFSEAVKSLI